MHRHRRRRPWIVCEALVVLSGSPGLGVTELGRRVGLSQPAAARMVDSLEGHGLALRRATSGRSVAVDLTPGRRRRRAADPLLPRRSAERAGRSAGRRGP
ncbi:MarR family transcriptional regulator [Actinoallomurus acanthiterrae]